MIISFKHKGLEKFFLTGNKSGIQAKHLNKLTLQLAALNAATCPQDLSAPNWRLHPLHGDLSGHWAITVSGNWRLTFKFNGLDAEIVDYQDYH